MRSGAWSRLIWMMAALLLAFAVGGDALAKGKKGKKGKNADAEIQMTDIKAFDDVFKRVEQIDKDLGGAERDLTQSKNELNKALGIKNDTPIRKALADLQDKGDGKIQVALKGNVPTLQATEAVPSNVQDGIDAVNSMTASFSSSLDALANVHKQTSRLVRKTKDFPNTLRQEFSKDANFLEMIFQLPKTTKVLKTNIAITAGLPGRSTKVVSRMTEILSIVNEEFSPLAAK